MRWTSHSRRRFRKKSATSSAMRGTLLGVALRGCGRQAETGNARAAKAGQRSVVGSGLARVRKGKNRTALPDLDHVAAVDRVELLLCPFHVVQDANFQVAVLAWAD